MGTKACVQCRFRTIIDFSLFSGALFNSFAEFCLNNDLLSSLIDNVFKQEEILMREFEPPLFSK